MKQLPRSIAHQEHPPQEARRVKLVRSTVQRLPRGKRISLAVARKLIGETFVMEIEPGVVIEAELSDYVARYGFLYGFNDISWRFARRFIRSGQVVCDVGANIGA